MGPNKLDDKTSMVALHLEDVSKRTVLTLRTKLYLLAHQFISTLLLNNHVMLISFQFG